MNANQGWIARGASAWVAFAQRHALLVTLAVLLGVAGCAYYTTKHIGINTDNADMISAKVDWRRTSLDYQAAFPQYTDSLVVVIDADNADLADYATRELARALRAEPDLFHNVYVPGGGEFFDRNGLLYLSVDELQELADRLIQVQPFLGRLAPDPSMDNFFMLLAQAMDSQQDKQDWQGQLSFELDPIFTGLRKAFSANSEGEFHRLSWHNLIAGSSTATGTSGSSNRRFIELQPVLAFDALSPAAEPMSRIRGLAQELGLNVKHGVRIRLTGQAALEGEELVSVSQGAALGGALALVAVALILLFALRSVRLVLASLLTLIAGLIGTAAFAALAVGTLNLISVAFAVLYIGLGIDYAIHLCLRYRELVCSGLGGSQAMQTAAADVGASLVICAVTTAVGFYAFVPTAYAGVAELGLISGTGMFISLIVTLTLLPALLALAPLPSKTAASPKLTHSGLAALPVNRRRWVLSLAGLAALAAISAVPWVHFNTDTLDLRDASAESVQTYRELMADPQNSPQTLSSLAPDLATAQRMSAQLKALPEVTRALTLADFVPANQADKLVIVEDLSFTLALSEPAELKPGDFINSYRAVVEFKRALNGYLDANPKARQGAAGELDQALEQWNTAISRAPLLLRQERMQELHQSLLTGLPPRLRQLQASLLAQEVSLNNLPDDLHARWLSETGAYRVEIFPSQNLDDSHATHEFVNAVQRVAPAATGPTVLEQSGGRTVVFAFVQAFSYAVIGITLLLLVLLRSIADSLRVLVPLAWVALLVAAATLVLGIPFNFANIIALPLLFGVGVDNGIHVVYRMRQAPPDSGLLLTTSTARGVFFSGLTTIAGFGALAFSHHAGTASMGQLLAIGMLVTLVSTLIVLPALLPAASHRRLN